MNWVYSLVKGVMVGHTYAGCTQAVNKISPSCTQKVTTIHLVWMASTLDVHKIHTRYAQVLNKFQTRSTKGEIKMYNKIAIHIANDFAIKLKTNKHKVQQDYWNLIQVDTNLQ